MRDLAGQKFKLWRSLAAELREDATRATLPGLAEKLIHAAEDLERYADGLIAWESAA